MPYEAGDAALVSIASLEQAQLRDDEFVRSAEWQGAAVQALLASAQETEREKIDLYAELLAGAASRQRPEALDLRALLSTLISLSVREVKLARALYAADQAKKWSIVAGNEKPDWGPDTDFCLKRLEGVGLIEQRAEPGMIGPVHAKVYPTATFHRLMTLLAAAHGTIPDPPDREHSKPGKRRR